MKNEWECRIIDVVADMTGMHDVAEKKYPSTNKYFFGMQTVI